MIYMSIQDEVNTHVALGQLIKVRQSFPLGVPDRRVIYVTPILMSLLDSPWGNGDIKWEKRWSRARWQVDEFIDGLPGDRIMVRSAPRKKSTCFMSLLDSENDDIWEIRCQDPKPGIRIFGSFVKQDEFVALTALPHECLSSEEDWNRATQQYKE
jgi:hypothetical protein